MMQRQFLSRRLCNTANVRQMLTSACMNNSETAIPRNDNDQFSATVERCDGNHVHEIGSTTPQHTYIDTSKFQRFILSIGSSIAALINPHRFVE